MTVLVSGIVIVGSLLSVVGSTCWFRLHETTLLSEPELACALPTSKAQFQELPVSEEVKAQLLFDSAQSARWVEADRTRWQIFHFRWKPARSFQDRARAHLAKSHRPEICLPAAGRKLDKEFDGTIVHLAGLTFPFRTYRFYQGEHPLYVFYCAREDGSPSGEQANMRETHLRRLEAALKGRRGLGQRVIEVVIFGGTDLMQAQRSLERELTKMFSAAAP